MFHQFSLYPQQCDVQRFSIWKSSLRYTFLKSIFEINHCGLYMRIIIIVHFPIYLSWTITILFFSPYSFLLQLPYLNISVSQFWKQLYPTRKVKSFSDKLVRFLFPLDDFGYVFLSNFVKMYFIKLFIKLCWVLSCAHPTTTWRLEFLVNRRRAALHIGNHIGFVLRKLEETALWKLIRYSREIQTDLLLARARWRS